MYIRSIRLKNICGIKELELCLTRGTEQPGHKLIIGKNGTGKSSILRSIVLGLASDAEATTLLADPFGSPFVSTGEKTGVIELEVDDDTGRTSVLTKKIQKNGHSEERVTGGQDDTQYQRNRLVVAFGAGRSNEGAESSPKAYRLLDSTWMLFNYEGTFIQPELTLRRLKDYVGDHLYPAILSQIKSALSLSEEDTLEFSRGGGVVVSGPDRENPIPLHSWADGYRVTLNWILDIYAWAMKCEGSFNENTGEVHGLLLVDEIEQHLHPTMQRGIFENLKRLFPKLQILASTHSPLVVQGVESTEIVSLHLSDEGITSAPLGDYYSASVEDLLTAEELFRTPPYSITVEKTRDEYEQLITKTNLSHEEQGKLRDLGQQLAASKNTFTTPGRRNIGKARSTFTGTGE